MDALLARLPAMDSRAACDELAVAFCYANSKAARRRLVRGLHCMGYASPAFSCQGLCPGLRCAPAGAGQPHGMRGNLVWFSGIQGCSSLAYIDVDQAVKCLHRAGKACASLDGRAQRCHAVSLAGSLCHALVAASEHSVVPGCCCFVGMLSSATPSVSAS